MLPIVDQQISTNGSNANGMPISVDDQQQSKLKTILIIGITAAALVGLIYLEVKYGLIRAGLVLLLSNPTIITGVLVIAAVAVAYLVYLKIMQPSQKAADQIENNASEEDFVGQFDRVVPATLEEYQNALSSMAVEEEDALQDESLEDYFRRRFPAIGQEVLLEEDAQFVVADEARALKRKRDEARSRYNALLNAGGGRSTVSDPNEKRLRENVAVTGGHFNEFYGLRALALHFLMTAR